MSANRDRPQRGKEGERCYAAGMGGEQDGDYDRDNREQAGSA